MLLAAFSEYNEIEKPCSDSRGMNKLTIYLYGDGRFELKGESMTDLMRKLELLWGSPIFYMENEDSTIKNFGNYSEEENPFKYSRNRLLELLQRSREQKVPVIYRDTQCLYFICACTKNGYYFTGPFTMENLSYLEIKKYYRNYGIPSSMEKPPVHTTMLRLLTFASLIYELLEGVSLSIDEILRGNHLTEEFASVELENTRMEIKNIDENLSHHTYQEERYVMDCVREGNVEEVLGRLDALMETAGILSNKQINHQKNLAIVAVAMTTRESIAGGISPADAYRLSDIYINKIDRAVDIEEILEYNRRAVIEFTKLVSERKEKKKNSSYTEKCKDYIHKNYHHKIYLEVVACEIGISQGYLSRCFRKDTGMSIQEYIQKFRVERAANLLKYSEASLTEISDYVCFHSQSHFGGVFKKYMNMTPKEYRDKYKEIEFSSRNIKKKSEL